MREGGKDIEGGRVGGRDGERKGGREGGREREGVREGQWERGRGPEGYINRPLHSVAQQQQTVYKQ